MSPLMCSYMCSCLCCKNCKCANVCSTTCMCAHMFAQTCRWFLKKNFMWCRTTWTPPDCLTPSLYPPPSFLPWDKLRNHSGGTAHSLHSDRKSDTPGFTAENCPTTHSVCVCAPIQIWKHLWTLVCTLVFMCVRLYVSFFDVGSYMCYSSSVYCFSYCVR